MFKITIVGGPHPSAVPRQAMDYFNNADYGFVGEYIKDFCDEQPVVIFEDGSWFFTKI